MAKPVKAHKDLDRHVIQEMGRDVRFKDGERAKRHVSIVEISVSCSNLLDTDLVGKSDPMCVLYVQEFGSTEWKLFDKTEVVKNNLNPIFVKKFVMDYFFEESQKLRFDVYDVDSQKKIDELKRHDFLGRIECNLGEIVGPTKLERKLKDRTCSETKNRGEITLIAEELGSCKEEITLAFCGKKLDKKDLFGSSDPFLKFYRTNEKDHTILVHQTECIKNTLNPTWESFTIPVRALCNGDHHMTIKVECYDYNRDGNHNLIGVFETTVDQLKQGPAKNKYECIHDEKKAKNKTKYKHSGMIELISCNIKEFHSFLDYIKGGYQIHANVAVDFTSSNGEPDNPASLHYNSAKQPNEYEVALKAVVGILEDYDSDKQFPAFGFGAIVPPDGKVSHDFSLNLDPTNPSCKGVDGILDAYRKSLKVVDLKGPTNFAPVINRIAEMARVHKAEGDNYFILLIITDGVIQDLKPTSEAIVKASLLPLSIIIVGVGSEKFKHTDFLDGKKAERDIVQFLPLREFLGKAAGGDIGTYTARLAKEVLYKIPEQFLSYMTKHKIVPKPPIQRQTSKPGLPSYETATKQKVKFQRK